MSNFRGSLQGEAALISYLFRKRSFVDELVVFVEERYHLASQTLALRLECTVVITCNDLLQGYRFFAGIGISLLTLFLYSRYSLPYRFSSHFSSVNLKTRVRTSHWMGTVINIRG